MSFKAANYPISKRYAKALLQIAIAKKTVKIYRKQLEAWDDAFKEHENLNSVFLNPKIPTERKIALIKQLFKKHDAMVINFMQLLVHVNRVYLLSQIASVYAELTDEFLKQIPATVYSAEKLPHQQSDMVLKALTEHFNKQVILSLNTDPDLLGGVKVEIGSWVFDGSIKNRLNSFIEQIYLI